MVYRAISTLLTASAIFIAMQHPVAGQEKESKLLAKPLAVTSRSAFAYGAQPLPLSIVQERAKFEADQRLLRLEWNKWIGYSPLRPSTNASYMSNGRQLYFIPSRGAIVSATMNRSWY